MLCVVSISTGRGGGGGEVVYSGAYIVMNEDNVQVCLHGT